MSNPIFITECDCQDRSHIADALSQCECGYVQHSHHHMFRHLDRYDRHEQPNYIFTPEKGHANGS